MGQRDALVPPSSGRRRVSPGFVSSSFFHCSSTFIRSGSLIRVFGDEARDRRIVNVEVGFSVTAWGAEIEGSIASPLLPSLCQFIR